MNKEDEVKQEESLDDFFAKQEPVKPKVHSNPENTKVCISCEG